MLSLLHPCDRIAYINNNLQFDKWWNAVVSNRRHYVKVHIADIKGQKSLDVSTNVKPRMGVFPLRAKIWDALDEGCSCWEMEDKREWEKQWKSKKGCAIQREKDRIRTKRWKKDAQGAWKISRWFPLFFYQSSSSLTTDGSLVPDYFPPSSITKDPPAREKYWILYHLRERRNKKRWACDRL